MPSKMTKPLKHTLALSAFVLLGMAATLAQTPATPGKATDTPATPGKATDTPATPGKAADTPATSATPTQSGAVTLAKSTLLPAPLTYQIWNGVPVLDQIINDKALERFVLGTGLNVNTITPAAATRLQIAPNGQKMHVMLLQSAQDAGATELQSLKIGLVTVEKAPVALFDVTRQLSGSAHADAPTGWLGTPYLSAFQVTFDPVGNVLILDSPLAHIPQGKDITNLPMTMRDGRPYVTVSLPGAKPFLALVDTGSAGTLIPASALGRNAPKGDKVVTVALPNGQQASYGVVTLPSLRVGKAEWKNARALAAMDAPKAGEPAPAILGMDFLGRFKVTLNYAQQRLVLAPIVLPKSAKPAGDKPVDSKPKTEGPNANGPGGPTPGPNRGKLPY